MQSSLVYVWHVWWMTVLLAKKQSKELDDSGLQMRPEMFSFQGCPCELAKPRDEECYWWMNRVPLLASTRYWALLSWLERNHFSTMDLTDTHKRYKMCGVLRRWKNSRMNICTNVIWMCDTRLHTGVFKMDFMDRHKRYEMCDTRLHNAGVSKMCSASAAENCGFHEYAQTLWNVQHSDHAHKLQRWALTAIAYFKDTHKHYEMCNNDYA